MRKSRKKLAQAIVLTIVAADCAGAYWAHSRLTRPLPDDARYDAQIAAAAGDTGIFRPDQGLPSLTSSNVASPKAGSPTLAMSSPASPKAARAETAPVKLARADTPARFSPVTALVAPASSPAARPAATLAAHPAVLAATVATIRAPAAVHVPAAVPLVAAATPHAAPLHHAAHRPAPDLAALGAPAHSAGTSTAHTLTGHALAGHTLTDRHFASAFHDMANPALDVPITQQVEQLPDEPLLASDGTAPDVQLAHNSGLAPSDAPAAASVAPAAPDTGAAITLPDTDKL